MYYETIIHEKRPVSGPEEAARLIKAGEARDFDALVWTNHLGQEICVVADNHCNNSWAEGAVINLTTKRQIESITCAWVDTEEDLERLFRESCGEEQLDMGAASIPFADDKASGDTIATFECSCCGRGFKSTINKQRKYDQDNGYGRCSPGCGAY